MISVRSYGLTLGIFGAASLSKTISPIGHVKPNEYSN